MGTPILTLPISAAALREVDLIGVFRYANTYPAGIDLLSRMKDGKSSALDLRKLITHRFVGFEGIERAFQMAGKAVDDDGKLVIKVVVEMDEGQKEA
jgi:L-iditol 2-dehydrogenase